MFHEVGDEKMIEKTLGVFGVVLLINFVLNVVGAVNCLYIFIHLLFSGLLGVYLAKKSSPKIKLKIDLVVVEVIRYKI